MLSRIFLVSSILLSLVSRSIQTFQCIGNPDNGYCNNAACASDQLECLYVNSAQYPPSQGLVHCDASDCGDCTAVPPNLGATIVVAWEGCNCHAGYYPVKNALITDNQVYFCVQCLAGTYSSPGSSTCTPCNAGTWSGVGYSSCTPCNAGTYSTPGASSCTPCNAGTYSTPGATTCTSCNAGTWSNEGSSSCPNCPLGGWSNDGAGLCSCVPGWVGNGSSCQQCPAGQTSPWGSDGQNGRNMPTILANCH
jgi:hypothetical protein